MNTTTSKSEHAGHQHRSGHSPEAHGAHCNHADTPATVMKDPVCGMSVTPGTGKPSFTYQGKTWHFCSQKCHDKFAADPTHYSTGAHKVPAKAVPKGTRYACPMHPEIVRDAPGDCPKCGMALEPMGVPAGDEGPNPELLDFKRRFAIGAVLTIPLLLLTMGPFVDLGFLRDALGERRALWVEFFLATPVVLWAGWPFFVRGVKSVVSVQRSHLPASSSPSPSLTS